jgi:nitric oxide reductase NorD protein
MPLDEYIFGKFANYFKNNKKYSNEIVERSVSLIEIKSKLTILSRATTGRAIQIFPAEKEGGYKNDSFFLPTSFSEFSTKQLNLSYYLYRILYLSIQKKLNLNWDNSNEQSVEVSQQKAIETSQQVLNILYEEYPVTKELHQAFTEEIINKSSEKNNIDYTWLYGKWMKNEMDEVEDKKLKNFSDKVKKSAEKQPTTIIKAKPVESIVSIEVDKKQQEDYVMTHNFEKVETAEEAGGAWRDFDGKDELEEHQSALEELKMKQTVRVDNPVHSILRAEFVENTTVLESSEKDYDGFHYKYDEWDESKRSYKKDFCSVYPAYSF